MDNDTISISIVMPVYNGESFIGRTLDNVFSQTSLPTELILVDDGSKDTTVNVIENFINNHPEHRERIKLLKQPNKGAGAARNLALKNSISDWIAFFDSDDIWDVKKLEIVRQEITNNPDVTIITHDEYEVDESNLTIKKYMPRHEKFNPETDLFVQLYKGNFFSTTCMVIKRSVIDKAGCFDETLLSAQDYDMWIRCVQYAKVCYLDKPLATYVTRPNNITSNTFRRYKCEMIICKKYKDLIYEKLGKKRGKKIVLKRVFQIHKMEAYLSLLNKQVKSFFQIVVRLPIEMLKE